MQFCEIAPPIALTSKELQKAFELKWADLEDCLISLAASKVGADYIVTRDAEGFERSSVPPITPKELLAKIRMNENLEYAETGI